MALLNVIRNLFPVDFERCKYDMTINSNQRDSCVVTIAGPTETLKRSFKHLTLDIYMVNKGALKVEKKELATVRRTVCSHIEYLIKRVPRTPPISPLTVAPLKIIPLLKFVTFLGEKYIRRVQMVPDLTLRLK
uniref:Uncharacterized protein n=1 Tax=Glossina palpalis gambiensis TaxID=67801 RepID=A0A1B0AY07_9MUSC